MTLAGNILGRTNTLPIEVYAACIAGADRRAHVLVLTAVSAAVLVSSERLGRRAG
jgi:ABC-type molybdate transport system permease subunit